MIAPVDGIKAVEMSGLGLWSFRLQGAKTKKKVKFIEKIATLRLATDGDSIHDHL